MSEYTPAPEAPAVDALPTGPLPTPFPELPPTKPKTSRNRVLAIAGAAVAVAGIAVAATLALTGGTSADPAAVKACQTLDTAVTDEDSATHKWSAAGAGRSGDMFDNMKLYTGLRTTRIEDAYETAPLVLRSDIGDVLEMAKGLDFLMVPGNYDEATANSVIAAYYLSVVDVRDGCEKAGVDMHKVDDNGQVVDYQPSN